MEVVGAFTRWDGREQAAARDGLDGIGSRMII
jgi:hypothetical protein